MPAHAETDSDVVQPISPGSPEPTPAEPPITGEGVEAVAAAAGPENPTAGQIPVPIEETRNKQEPSHMARTEYAEPERISEKDAPPAPPPDESLEASEKTAPEAQVVMETTADPALPYETDQTGEVTPEATASVSEGRGEETHIAENLTEPASSRVSQQETGETVAGTADDLTRIDGIGPKSAAALRAAGIDSFQKLANTSEARLIEILRAGNVRLVGSTSTWAQQAAYAARGDWEGFNRYIQENKSRGRD
jgi:predicted flap endonuclease-1-like 5' DNA nuclease